jgi:hypothetical protein
MDVLEPGFSLYCVIDPWCFLCHLVLPLFLQQDIHLGIWHIATGRVALISQFLICSCISFISVCAYVSCRHISSCWVVFKFVMYVIGSVVLFASLTITRVRPLNFGCCANLAVAVICDVLLVSCTM